MELAVKLDAFEGPLDLLLHLIDKNKVNIYDIPIVEITAQYLEYVNAMDKQDLDLVSEFLVMAATLLNIKSKMLLPAETDDEGEEEDPRAELVERLLEYRKYKYISGDLQDMSVGSDHFFYKDPTIPKAVLQYKLPVNLDELLQDVTMVRLKTIFDEVLRRQVDKIDPVRSQFGKIHREEVQISDKITEVKQKVQKGGRVSFRNLLRAGASKIEIVVTFLAILELVKTGEVFLAEDSTRDDIIIEGNG